MRRNLIGALTFILVLAFGGLLATLIAGNKPALGLDLQGGVSITQQPVGAYNPGSLDLAVERIRERVDSLGVAEPEIIRQDDAIVVNLPGVKNQQQAIDLVQVSGQVYLRPVLQCVAGSPTDTSTTTPTGESSTSVGETTTAAAATATTTGASGDVATTSPATTASASSAPGTTAAPGPSRTPHGVARPTEDSTPSTTVAASTTAGATTTAAPSTTAATGSTTATGSTVAGDATSTTTVTGSTTADTGVTTTIDPATATTAPEDPTQSTVLPLKGGGQCYVGPAGGTGTVFQDNAAADVLPGSGWGVTVSLRDGASGVGLWNQLATECYNGGSTCPTRQLAIELDGTIISAPTVQQPTFDQGNVQITGSFTEGEAKNLARVLNSGSLPVKLEVKSTDTVSPTLGKDSLRAALISGLVGVGLVLLFMLLYYRFLGWVVVAGIIVSGALLYSLVSLLSATQGLALSLSGIAGIIVSVGVTVDSFVVFFERLKDEVRSGRTMRNSAQRGFAGAWHTIIVADLVSLIGAAVLWYLTVGSVRNFAFFLGVSTMSDLVVAWFFLRPAVLLLARTQWMARRKVMGIEAVQVTSRMGAAS